MYRGANGCPKAPGPQRESPVLGCNHPQKLSIHLDMGLVLICQSIFLSIYLSVYLSIFLSIDFFFRRPNPILPAEGPHKGRQGGQGILKAPRREPKGLPTDPPEAPFWEHGFSRAHCFFKGQLLGPKGLQKCSPEGPWKNRGSSFDAKCGDQRENH